MGLLSGTKPLARAVADAAKGVRTGERISTRFPHGETAIEDPINEFLTIDTQAMRDSGTKAWTNNMRTMQQYPQLRTPLINPDRRADYFTGVMTDNLIDVYERIPADIREISKQWYVGANRFAAGLADRYNTSMESASAVVAAMSPQKDWYQNASFAERVMDIYHNPGQITPEIAATARRLFQEDFHQSDLEQMLVKPWEEMGRRQKAMYIRAKDETENVRNYRVMSPTGEMMDWARTQDGTPRTAAWGSLGEIEKAVTVLDDPSIATISRAMGGMHKVRNFYNNIVDPFSPGGDVTIDTHAVAADLLAPYGGSSAPVQHNFGGPGSSSSAITGAKGTYGLHADVYRGGARQLGILPRELQSITWEGIRGLFSDVFKRNRQAKADIDRIWSQFSSRAITLREARDAIIERAGGISNPDWATGGLDRADAPGGWVSTYQGELPASGVSGSVPAGVDGGTGSDTARGIAGIVSPAAALAASLLGFMSPEEAEAAVVPSVLRAIKQLHDVPAQVAAGMRFPKADVENRARAYDQLRNQYREFGQRAFDRADAGAGGVSGLASGSVRYSLPGEYREALREWGISSPDLIEVADPGEFYAAISRGKAASQHGAAVYLYPRDEYQGMRLFLTDDGSAGYALKPDGDIVSAFSDGTHKGIGPHLIFHAIEEGGTKLDAFDTVLPELYSSMGFQEAARLRWNPRQAPPDWNPEPFMRFNQGQPDVSFMTYSNEPARPVRRNYVETYDDALQAQDSALNALAGGAAVGLAITPPGDPAGAPSPLLTPSGASGRGNESELTAEARRVADEFIRRRQRVQARWDGLREDLLGIVTRAVSAAENLLETDTAQTLLDMAEGGYGGVAGYSAGLSSVLQRPLDAEAAAQAVQQGMQNPDEAMREVGWDVTQATGQPAIGAAVYTAGNILSP